MYGKSRDSSPRLDTAAGEEGERGRGGGGGGNRGASGKREEEEEKCWKKRKGCRSLY